MILVNRELSNVTEIKKVYKDIDNRALVLKWLEYVINVKVNSSFNNKLINKKKRKNKLNIQIYRNNINEKWRVYNDIENKLLNDWKNIEIKLTKKIEILDKKIKSKWNQIRKEEWLKRKENNNDLYHSNMKSFMNYFMKNRNSKESIYKVPVEMMKKYNINQSNNKVK